jgi:hypothetical protein
VSCLLCDQAQETIQHILCTCVFARQFWHSILFVLDVGNLSPSGEETSFADWWRKTSKKIHKSKRKGMNNIIILGAWCLWIHRNKAVFNGETPSLSSIRCVFLDEIGCWITAGAKHLQSFGLELARNLHRV